MDISPKGFGLPKKLWRQLLKQRNKTVDECASDLMFKQLPFYSAYMQTYPVRDFQYTFNSWGFRADYDYEALNVDGKKAKIILAIGDSFTMNVGGPLEHSWPSLLQEKFPNIPVLNGGVDGLGPESYHLIVDKMRKYFDVHHTFCLFNLHGGATADQMADANSTEQKIHILKSYEWPHGSEIAFIPPWCWDPEMKKILLGHFPDAHAYMKDVPFKYADIPYDCFVLLTQETYMLFSNPKWPSLESIYQQLAMHNNMDNMLSDVDRHFFLTKLYVKCQSYFYRNRDCRHMSKMTNQMVADYFYSKVSKGVVTLN